MRRSSSMRARFAGDEMSATVHGFPNDVLPTSIEPNVIARSGEAPEVFDRLVVGEELRVGADGEAEHGLRRRHRLLRTQWSCRG